MLFGCSSRKTVRFIDWCFQFQIAKKDWRLNFTCGRQASTPCFCNCVLGHTARPGTGPCLAFGFHKEKLQIFKKIRFGKAFDICRFTENILRGKVVLPVLQNEVLFLDLSSAVFLLSFIHTRFLLGLYLETLISGDACRWDTGPEWDYPISFKSQWFMSDFVLIWGEVLILRLDVVCSYLTC